MTKNKKTDNLGELLKAAGLANESSKSEPRPAPAPNAAGQSKAPATRSLRGLIRKPEKPVGKPKRDLVLGLDFGTSSFKVVIRDPELGKAFAMPLVPSKSGLPSYLLPTAYGISESGEWVWSGGARRIPNPKAELLKAVESGIPNEEVLAYSTLACAAALRLALGEFGKTYGSKYKGLSTRWEINIGAPIQGKSNDRAVEVFRKIGAAAYALGMLDSKRPLTLKNVRHVLRGPYSEHLKHINVRPEVVSEVHGYRNSSARLEGLHALVDIGATTVDISTFIIHRRHDGDDAFEVLTAEVRPEGVHALKDNRLNNAIESLAALRSGKVATDPTEPPRDIEKFEKLMGLLVRNADRTIATKVRSLFVNVLQVTKERRYPNSPEWQSGVRVFLCGGGKDANAYREDIETLVKKGIGSAIRLSMQPLPKPNDLEFGGAKLKDIEYDRLAVAYGLSYPQIDFGVVNYPESISDVSKTGQSRDERQTEFSKEASAD